MTWSLVGMVTVLMLAVAFFAVIAAGIQQYVKSEEQKRRSQIDKDEIEILKLKKELSEDGPAY